MPFYPNDMQNLLGALMQPTQVAMKPKQAIPESGIESYDKAAQLSGGAYGRGGQPTWNQVFPNTPTQSQVFPKPPPQPQPQPSAPLLPWSRPMVWPARKPVPTLKDAPMREWEKRARAGGYLHEPEIPGKPPVNLFGNNGWQGED